MPDIIGCGDWGRAIPFRIDSGEGIIDSGEGIPCCSEPDRRQAFRIDPDSGAETNVFPQGNYPFVPGPHSVSDPRVPHAYLRHVCVPRSLDDKQAD